MKLKDRFTDAMFRIYEPVIIRLEKLKAARMWRDGVRQCEKTYKEIGAPRVYLFYDTKHSVWAPMTYEPNKSFKISLKMLRRMGKVKGMQKIENVDDMKAAAFYYTPSKWGALGCREDNLVRTEKLKKWIIYYMESLSEPMRKCREYRQQLAGRRCQKA